MHKITEREFRFRSFRLKNLVSVSILERPGIVVPVVRHISRLSGAQPPASCNTGSFISPPSTTPLIAVNVVYTGFEKVFDRVDHVILLRYVNVRVRNSLRFINLVVSYLTNRSETVVFGRFKSDFVFFLSSVRCLLYNVYILI